MLQRGAHDRAACRGQGLLVMSADFQRKRARADKDFMPAQPHQRPSGPSPTIQPLALALALQPVGVTAGKGALEAEADTAATQVVAGAEVGPLTPTSLVAGPSVPQPLLADDAATELLPGQLRKGEFLAALEKAICAVTEQELTGTGQTADGCPQLERWLSYYQNRQAVQIERTVRRYAPETNGVSSASDYIPLLAERVRRAVSDWSATGLVRGVPDEVSSIGPPTGQALDKTADGLFAGALALQPKTHPGERETAQPRTVQAQLGPGRPLEAPTQVSMEDSFRRNFTSVRVHDDAKAANLADTLHAEAFTVGRDIGFASGAYRPDTLVGRALLAHELAHTVQQSGGKATGGGSEQEADMATRSALTGRPAAVSARGGLALQRCSSRSKSSSQDAGPSPTIPDAAVPKLTHDERERLLAAFLVDKISDEQISPPEWQQIGKRTTELELEEYDLRDALENDPANVASADASATAMLANSQNPAIRKLAMTYSARLTGHPRTFAPNPIGALLSQTLADLVLDGDELDAIRLLAWSYGVDLLRAELEAAKISDPTRSNLLIILRFGAFRTRDLLAIPGVVPLRFQRARNGTLSIASDLRLTILHTITARNEWGSLDFPIIRGMTKGMATPDAAALFESGGIGAASATTLATEFTRDDNSYMFWIGDRTDLSIKFESQGQWKELTSQSRQELALPFHPRLVAPLVPAAGPPARRGELTASVSIGPHKFASGRTEEASRLSLTFRGHTMTLLASDRMLSADTTIFDRIEMALSMLPSQHLGQIVTLVLDPGYDPGGKAIADASRDGTVNMYLSGAGASVPQADLNQTTAHETGHLISFQAERSDSTFWPRWKDAQKIDGIVVSRYATTNEYEDFAETYVLYLSGAGTDAALRARYSKRFAIMDTFFAATPTNP